MTLSKHAVICGECNFQMRVIEMGVDLIETSGDPPRPYQLYSADLYCCPLCGKKVVAGLGRGQDVKADPRVQEKLEAVLRDGDYHVCYEIARHAKERAPITGGK